jgi:hypothetical protein
MRVLIRAMNRVGEIAGQQGAIPLPKELDITVPRGSSAVMR